MIVIDLTTQLAPIAVGLVVALVIAALGLVTSLDPDEIRPLRRWVRSCREAVAALRGAGVTGGDRLASGPRG